MHHWRVSLCWVALLSLLVSSVSAVNTTNKVNGRWTQWSVLTTPCTATCGGGTQIRIRTCTDPIPQNEGLRCLDTNYLPADVEQTTVVCHNESCWSHDPQWYPWSNCSTVCGFGNQTRGANCSGPLGCGGTTPPDDVKACNTWNRSTCPSPCLNYRCPDKAVCIDKSNDTHPLTACSCVMGYVMTAAGKCMLPPPTTPTPRPIPSMAPAQKMVATVVSTTASSVIIFFLTLTLVLFLVMRVYTTDRVIQMNMEIALICAHLLLVLPNSIIFNVFLCKLVSMGLHLFFLATFMFMMLESVHMYMMVAYVVRQNGLFNRKLNIAIGWGVSVFIVVICVALYSNRYGSPYMCWMMMNTELLVAQQLPILVLMIVTFTLIEAAGADEYKKLKGMDRKGLTSAKFSQRTNLLIMPFVYASWVIGTLSQYNQDLALYSIFSIVNGWLGACIFFCHCSNNEEVRAKLKYFYKHLRGRA